MKTFCSRYLPFSLGLFPFVPGWIAALIQHGPTPQVFTIGGEATLSAIVFGVPVWEHALRRDPPQAGKWRQWTTHALLALLFAAAWVWTQYALNPFRVRPVLDALMSSSALSFQLVTGVCIYVAYVLIGLQVRSRAARPAPVAAPRPADFVRQLSCRVGKRTMLLPVDEVGHIEGCDDYVAVHLNGRRLLTSHRLAELATTLDPARFIRVHRSHIVNLDFVSGLESGEGNRLLVILKSGERIRTSRPGAAALRDSEWFRRTR